MNADRISAKSYSIPLNKEGVLGVRAVSTTSLFLPHKVMCHIKVEFSYRYVILNFMWKKKGGRRHTAKYDSRQQVVRNIDRNSSGIEESRMTSRHGH